MSTILHHSDRCNLFLSKDTICNLLTRYRSIPISFIQPKDCSKSKVKSLRNLPFEINFKNCLTFYFNFWGLLINSISIQKTLINCNEIFNDNLFERSFNSTNITRNKINNYSIIYSISTNQL